MRIKKAQRGDTLTESGRTVRGKEAKQVKSLEKSMVNELTKRGPVWDTTPKKPAAKKKMKMGGKLTTAKGGKQMLKRADGSTSQRGLWDNIRAAAKKNKAAGKAGKKPTAAMLKQEKKIKAKGK
jgi:hypothetical protein